MNTTETWNTTTNKSVSDTWKQYIEKSAVKTTFMEVMENLEETCGLEAFQVRLSQDEISRMVDIASKKRITLDDVANNLIQMAWDFRSEYSKHRQEILENMSDEKLDYSTLSTEGNATYYVKKDFLMDKDLVRKTCIVGKGSKKNASGGEMPSRISHVVEGKRKGLWFSTGVVMRMALHNYSLFERHQKLINVSTTNKEAN